MHGQVAQKAKALPVHAAGHQREQNRGGPHEGDDLKPQGLSEFDQSRAGIGNSRTP